MNTVYSTFVLICSVLRMRNVSDDSQNQSTLYVRYVFLENRAVHEIMWKNMVEPDRRQMAIL
jgi:hypothetical protein